MDLASVHEHTYTVSESGDCVEELRTVIPVRLIRLLIERRKKDSG
jgi:hypothetical protein